MTLSATTITWLPAIRQATFSTLFAELALTGLLSTSIETRLVPVLQPPLPSEVALAWEEI